MSRAELTPRRPWQGARVLLGVTGGIAAYKVVQVARDLTRLGATVDTVLTRGAREFVRPLTFEAVTGRAPHIGLFPRSGPAGHRPRSASDPEAPWTPSGIASGTGFERPSTPEGSSAAFHLRLAHETDLVCVAPATADLLARAAHGRGDDLLATVLLATRAPVILFPAMNDRMWSHPQVRTNAEHCRDALGYRIVGPAVGPLAFGEGEGPGRLVEPGAIVEHVGRILGEQATFVGRTVLITAGPTREPVDAVRFVGNRSSGRMGFAVARAAWRRGARVVLVTGPTHLEDPLGVDVVRVETARQMEAAVREALPDADVSVFAAAVSDYRPADLRNGKIKRSREGDDLTLALTANPDVAADTRELRRSGSVTVGFALESSDLLEHARDKLEAKGFDLLVANEVGEGTGFEADTNRVTLLDRDGGAEELPLQSKDAVAETLLDRVRDLLESG